MMPIVMPIVCVDKWALRWIRTIDQEIWKLCLVIDKFNTFFNPLKIQRNAKRINSHQATILARGWPFTMITSSNILSMVGRWKIFATFVLEHDNSPNFAYTRKNHVLCNQKEND
jgi:hypothetical protein